MTDQMAAAEIKTQIMSLDLPELPKPELPAIGILSNLSDDDRQRLGALGQFLRIKRGGLLIQEGVDQNRLYVVVRGSFKIAREKTDSVIAILEAGESIGEVNIFDPDVATLVSPALLSPIMLLSTTTFVPP